MQKELAQYLQITGMILGFLLVIVWGLRWLRQRSTEEVLLDATPEASQEAVLPTPDALTPRIGWIVRRPEGGAPTDSPPVGMAVRTGDQTVWTAAHVVAGAGDWWFYAPADGYLPLRIESTAPAHDLARGRLDDELSFPELPRAITVSTGEPVFMRGWTGDAWEMVAGTIIDPDGEITLRESWGEVRQERVPVLVVRLDNTLGDSGAPVVNARGELIGLLVAVDLDDESVSYVARVYPEPEWSF